MLTKKEFNLIAKEDIKNFDDGKKKLNIELKELKKEMKSTFYFVKDKKEVKSFGLLKPLKINYLGKTYKILGIGNILAIEKGKGHGRILMKKILKDLKKKNKTGLGFTGNKIEGFYRKIGFTSEIKLKNRFFYDYGNKKTNKKEKGWWGIYYEGKDKFITNVLKTKLTVMLPCEHW